MNELDITYQLLRAALQGGVPHIGEKPVETHRWWQLFRLLQRNHVVALTAEAVAHLPEGLRPPREVLIPWLAECDKVRQWAAYQREVEAEIVDVMAKHGVETLVLKGSHLAEYYPQPLTREYGDIDLYFYRQHAKADRIARKELGALVTSDAHHHTKYDYRGVTIESHYDFVNRHTPWSNRRYEAMLKRLVGPGKQDSTVNKQQSTFEVLFLLRHMAGHFAASRITLRDLCDWCLTCDRLKGRVDWLYVQDTVSRYGMSPFAAILASIAEERLGLTLPLHGETDAQTVALVERDIVYGSASSVDAHDDGLSRLGWKLRRYHAQAWKRRLVFNDCYPILLLSTLTSHAIKPQSLLHKQ